MPDAKRFVYIIQSIARPGAYYVGLTSDVEGRSQRIMRVYRHTPRRIAPGNDWSSWSSTKNSRRCKVCGPLLSTIQAETYRSEMLRLFEGFMLRCGLVGFIGSTIHVSPQCSHS